MINMVDINIQIFMERIITKTKTHRLSKIINNIPVPIDFGIALAHDQGRFGAPKHDIKRRNNYLQVMCTKLT